MRGAGRCFPRRDTMGAAASEPDYTIERFITEHSGLGTEKNLERVWEHHQAYVMLICGAHGPVRYRAYLLRCGAAYKSLGRDDAHSLRSNVRRLIDRAAEGRRRGRVMGLS